MSSFTANRLANYLHTVSNIIIVHVGASCKRRIALSLRKKYATPKEAESVPSKEVNVGASGAYLYSLPVSVPAIIIV